MDNNHLSTWPYMVAAFIFSIMPIVSCKKSVSSSQTQRDIYEKIGDIRSYKDARILAEASISFLQDESTKAKRNRVVDDWFTIGGPLTKGVKEDTLVYIFNFADSAGFAIISANPATIPILSVVEYGHLIQGQPTGVPAFDAYFENLLVELQSSSRESERGPGQPYSYWQYDTTGTRVFPLLGQTRWGQHDVYGNFCPNGICGCFATALGQIMKSFSWPTQFTAVCNISDEYPYGTVISPQWDSIQYHNVNHLNNKACSSFHDEISALLRDIGAYASSTYYTDGSGTWTYSSQMVPTLQHYGFSCSSLVSANTYTMISSLDARRPVFLFSPGHFFVADGYQDYTIALNKYEQAFLEPGYFVTQSIVLEDVHAMHINWGWDGNCNGYFAFGTYNTAVAVSYDTNVHNHSHDYSNGVQMVYGIHPVN